MFFKVAFLHMGKVAERSKKLVLGTHISEAWVRVGRKCIQQIICSSNSFMCFRLNLYSNTAKSPDTFAQGWQISL